jgi:hypothetical protein
MTKKRLIGYVYLSLMLYFPLSAEATELKASQKLSLHKSEAKESAIKDVGKETLGTPPTVRLNMCGKGLWFNNRCQRRNFFVEMVPKGEAFVSVFGSRLRSEGPGSIVLFTVDSDAVARQYHISAERSREAARTSDKTTKAKDSRSLEVKNTGGKASDSRSIKRKTTGAKVTPPITHVDTPMILQAGDFKGFKLLSRVTETRGMHGGWSNMYYEIATPKPTGDLTLYYSKYRQYGPSRWRDTICRSNQYLTNSGESGDSGCHSIGVIASSSAPSIRQQCMASEVMAGDAVKWTVTTGCNSIGGGIVAAAAIKASLPVFAAVTIETENPIAGGVAGLTTLGGITLAGGYIVGNACNVAGALADDLTGKLTGCVTTGLPGTAEEIADIKTQRMNGSPNPAHA